MSLIEVVVAVVVGVALAAVVSWLIVAGAARHVHGAPRRTRHSHDTKRDRGD